jgi:hypothetical protein
MEDNGDKVREYIMILKILIIFIASILSAILYRCGGKGKPFDTKYRDIGCPLVYLIATWLLLGFNISYWWVYLSMFGIAFAAMTTYWDFLFGYDNYYAHGFMIGLSTFPLFWLGVPWYAILAIIAFCSLGMGILSNLIDNDVKEELSRGLTYGLSLFFLLL